MLAEASTTAALLTVLAVLFLLRVMGQLLVHLRRPGWLPPTDQWYSGLLPYPQLLATQIVILGTMAVIITGLVGGAGWAVGPHRATGTFLLGVAYVYGGAMPVRYVIRMVRRPDQRWLGGCIPIVFHVVLATWLFLLAAQWRPPA